MYTRPNFEPLQISKLIVHSVVVFFGVTICSVLIQRVALHHYELILPNSGAVVWMVWFWWAIHQPMYRKPRVRLFKKSSSSIAG